MASTQDIGAFDRAVESALLDGVRRGLKEKLMAAVEAEIDAVVNAAVLDMKPRVQSLIDERIGAYLLKISVNGVEAK